MSALAIREIDDHVVDILKNRAVAHHRSLAGEVRAILTDVAHGVPVQQAGLPADEVARRQRLMEGIVTSAVPGVGTWSREEIYDDDER